MILIKKEVMLFAGHWTENLKSADGVLGVKAADQLFTQAKKPKQVVHRGMESTEGNSLVGEVLSLHVGKFTAIFCFDRVRYTLQWLFK